MRRFSVLMGCASALVACGGAPSTAVTLRSAIAREATRPGEVVGLGGGDDQLCVMRAEAEVACNFDRFLGDAPGVERVVVAGIPETREDRFEMRTVPGLRDAAMIAAGDEARCAILRGGQLACWGAFDLAIAGDANAAVGRGPIVVPGVSSLRSIEVGRHSCAVNDLGEVACWGSNGCGEAGLPTAVGSEALDRPRRVAGVSDATQVVVGRDFSCALTAGNEVLCWGAPRWLERASTCPSDEVLRAQLRERAMREDDPEIATLDPSTVDTAEEADALDWQHADDGRYCPSPQPRCAPAPPTRIGGLVEVVELAAGKEHVCARDRAGAVRCFGSNRFAKLGSPMAAHVSLTPIEVVEARGATRIVADDDGTCAIVTGGAVVCWGFGFEPWQLTEERGSPPPDLDPERGVPPARVPDLLGVLDVVVGDEWAAALLPDGSVRLFGGRVQRARVR